MAESQVKIAQKTWEMSNNILEVSAGDEIYKYDRQQQQSLLAAKPWDKDPHFFKDIKISALALLKMVMHARSGGNLEIMGLLLGKVCSNVQSLDLKLVIFINVFPGGCQRDGGDGQLRAAGGGHRDPCERPGPGLRVHDGLH